LSREDFERYYFSGSWVFPGWIGFSQRFGKEFRAHPARETLVAWGKMSKKEREEDTWFGLHLWEKKRLSDALGGFFQQKRVEHSGGDMDRLLD
jgi:hypothetical protein